MFCCFTIDRAWRIDPISSTHVTTIWTVTRPREIRLTLRLVLPRPESRSTPAALARDENHAGSSPDATADSTVAPTVNARTTGSIVNAIQAGGGLSRFRTVASSQSTDTAASPTP